MPSDICIAFTAASVRGPNLPSALPQSPQPNLRQKNCSAATCPPALSSLRVGSGAFCRTGRAAGAVCGAVSGAALADVTRRCHGSLWTSHDHPLAAALPSAQWRNDASTVFASAPYPPRATSTAQPQPWLLVPGVAAIAMWGRSQYWVPFQTFWPPPVSEVV